MKIVIPMLIAVAGLTLTHKVSAQDIEAVQLYSDAELVDMFATNAHLKRVRDTDRCQLAQDIEAQAELERRPTYQFLYGDMKAWGVCYDRDPELGLLYMEKAAQHGLLEALEQLGRYYHEGVLVQKDIDRAILYLREAASLGNLPAQRRFAEILLAGKGSPYDFQKAYHWLHNAVTANQSIYQDIDEKLNKLAERMPPSVVEKAKRPLD
ncbi:tetratricopeptide repeat protein [Idiomarina sp. HP20-50]|uniref:tetratricopeptide repeat protein n=1 Tax=Idiomarina sp. HP20-50 TaxID=3070813 RepID=UPI00294B2FFE|nr:tetratricopeptide repeat protein [Idiomarina sp. HP20-50]MDV6315791.1 tetratricopeptide repeat protein [Idiomarina sp. HP20-50]